jgi:hypothetical protein
VTVYGPAASGCAARGAKPSRTGDASGGGWSAKYVISDDDGIVLRDVRLVGRYMARRLSVPYLEYESDPGVAWRVELKPAGPPTANVGRLMRFKVDGTDARLRIAGEYQIPTLGSGGCITITQTYTLMKRKPLDQCAPWSRFVPAPPPCSRFYPEVAYRYEGPADGFHGIRVPQRLHVRVDGQVFNTGGLFRDALLPIPSPISDRLNPVAFETAVPVIRSGRAARWDNYHQTRKTEILEPGRITNGCPECVHIHWRWPGTLEAVPGFLDANSGEPRIPSGSTQDVEIGLVRHYANEIDPYDWRTLANRERLAYKTVGAPSEPPPASQPTVSQPVFWYEGHSTAREDAFFTHGGFFMSGAAGPPLLRSAGISPSRFTPAVASPARVASSSGATLRVDVSEPSLIEARIVRHKAIEACRGIWTQACRKPVGRLVIETRKGSTTRPFDGRVADKALPAGHYRMVLRAEDLTGKRSGYRRVAFTIVRPGAAPAQRPRAGDAAQALMCVLA